MRVRRIVAVVLIGVAVSSVSWLSGGSGGDTADATPAPRALWTGTACDGPSREVVARQCGWWMAPDYRPDGWTPWRLRWGPKVEAPLLADHVWDLGAVWRFDPPDKPSVPASAPWVFRRWYLALPLTVALLVAVRLLFVPPWRSRASREL